MRGVITAKHPPELPDEELRGLVRTIFAGPLPCDREQRVRQAALLDELADRPPERAGITPVARAAITDLAAQLRGVLR